MSSIPEQIALAAQSRLASQITVVNALSKLAFGGIEKLIQLNFDTARQSLEHSTARTQEWISAQEPQDLLSLAAAQGAPQLEEILSYGRELASISGLARSEFLHALDGLKPLFQLGQVGPDAVSIKVTSTKLSAPSVAIQTKAKAKTARKIPLATSDATPLVQPAKVKPAKLKLQAPKADDNQLSLLSGAEKKAVLKSPAKAEVVNPSPLPPAETPAVAKPAAKPAAKTGAMVIESKPTIEKTSGKELPVAAAEAKPASEPVLEKKTAVKFPFPANPKKPASKPAFPASNARPGYKAKGSAATGAKKPVRQ